MDTDVEIMLVKAKASTKFASLSAKLVAATDMHKDYREALGNATDGNKSQNNLKKDLKKTLAVAMNRLAVDIDSVAQGDVGILIESGFPYTEWVSNPKPQLKPAGIKLLSGPNSGDIIIKVEEAQGSYFLMYQYTLAPVTPATVWEFKNTNRKSVTFSDLTAGSKMTVRVISIGKDGAQIISDDVTSYVK
jgi:hypothetical protein